MQFTVVMQNLQNGAARDADGAVRDRWPLIVERLTTMGRPDVALLIEANGWDAAGHRPLARAMRDLDLDAMPLSPSPSGFHTAVLYNRERLGRWVGYDTALAEQTMHGFCVAAFAIPGLPKPLSFVPLHLEPYSAEAALIEAGRIASRGFKFGPYVVAAGDTNYAPADENSPLPHFATMRPYNIGSRTLMPDPPGADPASSRRPDRRVNAKFLHKGYVDVAQALFERTGDPQLLGRTAHDDRIDVMHVSKPLAPALISYRTLRQPQDATDHDGVAMTMETDLIDTADPWSWR